ncbi:hypothetical protein, partial [Shewanella sp. KT0246]|uniref:hypothetical protein n=1 Tax=Shewanella sp. KT0246 TaxID=2815912 RepID=UPI001C7CAC08
LTLLLLFLLKNASSNGELTYRVLPSGITNNPQLWQNLAFLVITTLHCLQNIHDPLYQLSL